MPSSRKRQYVDIEEFLAFIDRLAKENKWSKTKVIQHLIREGIKAVKSKENNDLIG